jgi:hypothetical protein
VENEIHEHIEHAAHESGHSAFPQWIGITVAALGVIMALCSAQLGAARTELIAMVVEENAAKTRDASVAHKYRSLHAQLQQVHAAMPNPKIRNTKTAEYDALLTQVGNPDATKTIKAGKLQTDIVLNTVTPSRDDVKRFLLLSGRIRDEADAARDWSDSYHDAVRVYTSTVEHFEIALLAAEIGIVIASVGLLLSKRAHFARAALIIAVVLGALSIGIAGFTKITNSHALYAAEHKIRSAEEEFAAKNRDKDDRIDDEKLEAEIWDNLDQLTSP